MKAAAEAERRRIELEVKTPSAVQLQRWWRIVRSEGLLRRWRATVERFTAPHRRLMAELREVKAAYASGGGGGDELTDDQRFLREGFRNRGRDAPPLPATRATGKRFELFITLRVGLGESAEGFSRRGSVVEMGEADEPSEHRTTAFSGYQIFSARSAVLKKAGTYFKAFFSAPENVDENRDENGHYIVLRSWKHFDAILDFMRDGEVRLPKAYVPATYDNRPATSEEEELLEFLREAHFYGLRGLVDAALPKLLAVKYGANPKLLSLLEARLG